MNKTVRNERRKLTAAWFNAIGTALMAVGVFAPVGSQIYGLGVDRADQTLVAKSSVVCLAVSIVLHLIGRQLLGGLEDDPISSRCHPYAGLCINCDGSRCSLVALSRSGSGG
jgi:hypothetical protein